jgi:ribosomal protein S21
LTKDIKRKEFYEKPSERMRRRIRKAIARQNRPDMPVKPEKKPAKPY